MCDGSNLPLRLVTAPQNETPRVLLLTYLEVAITQKAGGKVYELSQFAPLQAVLLEKVLSKGTNQQGKSHEQRENRENPSRHPLSKQERSSDPSLCLKQYTHRQKLQALHLLLFVQDKDILNIWPGEGVRLALPLHSCQPCLFVSLKCYSNALGPQRRKNGKKMSTESCVLILLENVRSLMAARELRLEEREGSVSLWLCTQGDSCYV